MNYKVWGNFLVIQTKDKTDCTCLIYCQKTEFYEP